MAIGAWLRRGALVSVMAAAMALGGCTDSKSDSKSSQSPPPTAPDAKQRSDDPTAVALDKSIVTPADLAPAGITAKDGPPGPEPQGPITTDGLVASLGTFGEVLRVPLEQAQVRAGGRRRYELAAPEGGASSIVSVIAVRVPVGPDAAGTLPSLAQSLTLSTPRHKYKHVTTIT